jgi:hypothetical protein
VRYDTENGAFDGGTIKRNVKGGCLQNGIVGLLVRPQQLPASAVRARAAL